MKYVSSAFDRLYSGGNTFLEEITGDVVDIGTIDPTRNGIDFIGEVFPINIYGDDFSEDIFPQKTSFTQSLLPLYRPLARKTAPPCLLVRISQAHLYVSVVYAGSVPDMRIVYETYRPNDRPAVNLASSEMIAAAALPEWHDYSTVYLFVGSAGSSNYAHFVADDMGRLKAVESLRLAYPGRKIVVVMTRFGGLIDLVRKDAVRAACGADIGTMFLDPDRVYKFPLLHYATPVSHHPVRKHVDAIDYVVETTEKAFEGEPLGERIFISRGATTSRVLVNEREIIEALRPMGFKVLLTDAASFDQQVTAMRGARIVIGQMGAAMTNTLFAPKGAELLYLAPSGWIETFYWDLAVARGQHYKVIYGTIISTGLPPNYSDFNIDLNEMMGIPMLSDLSRTH